MPFSKIGISPLLLAVFLMVIALPANAAAPKMALVIGNSDYRTSPLLNPGNDANLVAETLAELGFDVTLQEDLTYREFARVVADFGRRLAEKGPDTVGVFYYAGHAVQSDGANYLIPVDAVIQDELDLTIQTVPMSLVMKSLGTASNRLNLVFLDACRNNPFRSLTRSSGGGLARIDAPYGTLISYSTAPGAVAADGRGRNSPYTAALARAMKIPGLTVEQALKRVRLDVVERTNGNQIPWESSSLIGDFFFSGSVQQALVDTTPQPLPKPEPKATGSQFGPNTLPGAAFGGDMNFKDLLLSNVYEEPGHRHFRINLAGVQLDGEKVNFPYFSILSDFTSEPKSQDTLFFLRMVIQQRFLLHEESRNADYSACKGGFRKSSSGKNTIRLYLLNTDNPKANWPNFCVLDLMHEQDQRLWGAVLENIGVMLDKTEPSNQAARDLASDYTVAVSED